MRRYDERLVQVERVVGPREITEADLANSAAWRKLNALIAAALKPYPEASQAVIDHLSAYYEGAGVKRRRRR
jgi:hypothetical protein